MDAPLAVRVESIKSLHYCAERQATERERRLSRDRRTIRGMQVTRTEVAR